MAERHDIANMRTYKRDFKPDHFLLEIRSYSLLPQARARKYESCVFQAGGHKWRLSLYPNGAEGVGYISLYLEIVPSNRLPPSGKWEVDATFKLFIYDQVQKKYLTIEDGDGSVTKFNERKTKFGFPKVLRLKTFEAVAEGYLYEDCCILGAEVFVYRRNRKISTQSFVKQPTKREFKLKDFSSKSDPQFFPFTVHGKTWKLRVCPKGNTQEKNKSLSIFLQSTEHLKTHPSIYAEFKLRVLNEVLPKNSIQKPAVKHWFCSTSYEGGCPTFMSLKDLHERSKEFIKDNVLTVEVEILVVSVIKAPPK